MILGGFGWFGVHAFGFVPIGALLALDRLLVGYCLFCVVMIVVLRGLIGCLY